MPAQDADDDCCSCYSGCSCGNWPARDAGAHYDYFADRVMQMQGLRALFAKMVPKVLFTTDKTVTMVTMAKMVKTALTAHSITTMAVCPP